MRLAGYYNIFSLGVLGDAVISHTYYVNTLLYISKKPYRLNRIFPILCCKILKYYGRL